jgi:hypothetical protein
VFVPVLIYSDGMELIPSLPFIITEGCVIRPTAFRELMLPESGSRWLSECFCTMEQRYSVAYASLGFQK